MSAMTDETTNKGEATGNSLMVVILAMTVAGVLAVVLAGPEVFTMAFASMLLAAGYVAFAVWAAWEVRVKRRRIYAPLFVTMLLAPILPPLVAVIATIVTG